MMSGRLFPFHMSVSNITMYNPGNNMVISLGTNGADHEKYWFICDWSNLELTYRSSLFFNHLGGTVFCSRYLGKKAPTLNTVKDVFGEGLAFTGRQPQQRQLRRAFIPLSALRLAGSFSEQHGKPWLKCFPLCESMFTEVVLEDSEMCWRGVGGVE